MSERAVVHALRLADAGWALFPSKPYSKEPLVSDWRKKSTTTRPIIEQWFSRPNRNPLIDCGKSGLFVVDLDMKEGVDGRWNFWHILMDNGLDNPDTFMVRTPSNGLHIYYKAPSSVQLKNSAGKLAPGVDSRGYGGYVVAPGSVIEAGRYRVYRSKPVAEMPAKLVELFTPRIPERGQRPLRADLSIDAAKVYGFAVRRIETAPQGRRNDQLNRMAYWLGRFVGGDRLDRVTTEEILIEAGMHAGLSEYECVATVNSGLNAGELRPLGLIPIPNASAEIA